MTIYIVQPDDTIDKIATQFQANPDEIAWINQLAYPYPLAVGQALLIPTDSDDTSQDITGDTKRSIQSNGYAYPFIQPQILQTSLANLSELSIFSYGFTASGELLPPTLPVNWMIEAAHQTGTAPILTLTPLGTDGSGSH